MSDTHTERRTVKKMIDLLNNLVKGGIDENTPVYTSDQFGRLFPPAAIEADSNAIVIEINDVPYIPSGETV